MEALFADLKIDDDTGAPLTLHKREPLSSSPERQAVYTAAFPDVATGEAFLCVYTSPSGEKFEHLVNVVDGTYASPLPLPSLKHPTSPGS